MDIHTKFDVGDTFYTIERNKIEVREVAHIAINVNTEEFKIVYSSPPYEGKKHQRFTQEDDAYETPEAAMQGLLNDFKNV